VTSGTVHGEQLEERGQEAVSIDSVCWSKHRPGHRTHERALALIAANSSSVMAPLSRSALACESCSTDEDDDGAATLRM
jgi:hypothetical protein